MNVDKVSKVESSDANRDSIGRFLGSFAAYKASCSKRDSSPKEKKMKNSLAQSSNNHLNAISDGSKAVESNFSWKRVPCSSGATKSPTSNQSAVNSSNTTRTWNASCRRLLCSFGGSKSNPSNLSQASLFKKNEIKSRVAYSSHAAARQKSVGESIKVQHDCKDASRALTNRSLVASPKLGSPCSNNRERHSNVAGQSDRSQQSNPADLRKVQPIPIMKSRIQRTSSPKDPPRYNLRSRVQVHQSPKDPPAYNLRKKVQKSEVSKDSPIATQKKEFHKTEGPKASVITSVKRETQKAATQKTPGSKIPAAPVKKIGTAKTSTLFLANHDKKNHPSSSQYRPYSYIPIYHIRWDGGEERERSGHNCILCDKDLSCSPHDDYECHQDDEYDDEYKYRIEFRPQLLPAVDILPCGHAFHSECSRYVTPDQHSTDPECVLCLSMA